MTSILKADDTTANDTIATATGDSATAQQPFFVPLRKEQQTIGKESFIKQGPFADSPYLYLPHTTSHGGVTGEPIPYKPSTDNVITLYLIAIFIIGLTALSGLRTFIAQQTKNFFHMPRIIADETVPVGTLRLQYLLVLQVALILGLGTFLVLRQENLIATPGHTQWLPIGALSVAFILYFLMKATLYTIVNYVFFQRKENERWWYTWLYLANAEGLMLFPMLLLTIYFNISWEIAVYYTLFVIITIKILTLYKCFVIFFNSKARGFQIFLYFCTLELAPVPIAFGIMARVGSILS